MYEDFTGLNAIEYYLTRFVIPLFIAESLYLFTLPKRKRWILLFISTAFMFLMISINIIYFDLDLKTGWFRFTFLLIFLLSLLPMLATYSLKAKQTIFFALSAYAIQNLGDNLGNMAIFLSDLLDKKYEVYQLLIYSGIYAVVFVCYYFLFVQKFKADMIPDFMNGKIIYFITIITLMVVYIISMFAQSATDFVGFIASRVYGIVACLFLLFIQFNAFYSKKLETENKMFAQIIHNENEKYKTSKRNVDMINMRIHDLKHEVENIKEYARSKEEQLALANLQNELEIYNNEIETGNATLNFILAEKSLYCKNNGIKFSILADASALDKMNSNDIYSLFGNALDNAVEAVSNVKKENRTIIFNVIPKGKFITIHIENYTNEDVVFHDGLPITRKDKDYHGYGIKSILRVIKKYDGTYAISCKDHIFILNIVFSNL
ncbi:MAG TPA: hypothetical protein DDW18_00815 [Firmicutes bacterium]|nr:hypothetical protein [Bacillota bacterium]